MNYDQQRIDDAVLALLTVYSFERGRAWKGYDFDVTDRLHERGFIEDAHNKTKSIHLTPEGIERGLALAAKLFGPCTESEPGPT